MLLYFYTHSSIGNVTAIWFIELNSTVQTNCAFCELTGVGGYQNSYLVWDNSTLEIPIYIFQYTGTAASISAIRSTKPHDLNKEW